MAARMTRYAIVIEVAGANDSAYVPDLPGCVATGATRGQAERRIREAIALHLEGMRADGVAVPEPTTTVATVDAS
jgi:predicted RNase H-like HicB family nuclease